MISKNLSNIIFKYVGHKTIKYINPVTYGESTGDVRKTYDAIMRDYVLGPPFTLHAAVPELVTGIWSLVRETLIVNKNVSRLMKEEVAGGVSESNACPFCIEAHINMSCGEVDKGREDIYEWSKSHYQPDSELISYPPFSADEAPEIIGTALTFHYINRMVSVFVTDFPLPLPQFLSFLKPTIAAFFRLTAAKNITGVNVESGVSVKKTSTLRLPDEFLWAESNTYISDAFAGFDDVINRVGEQYIPSDVRENILTFIKSWRADIQELGTQWLEKEIADFDDEKKALSRFVLLISIQPYKITEEHINELRKYGYSDAQIIADAAWGSWQAIKRISSWLYRTK